jgi:hypothetical protein
LIAIPFAAWPSGLRATRPTWEIRNCSDVAMMNFGACTFLFNAGNLAHVALPGTQTHTSHNAQLRTNSTYHSLSHFFAGYVKLRGGGKRVMYFRCSGIDSSSYLTLVRTLR